MTQLSKFSLYLLSLFASMGAAAQFQVGPEPSKPPAEVCRGLAPEEFAKCEAVVNGHIQDLKDSRAKYLEKKNTFKPIPVLLEFEDGSTHNAKLRYEAVDTRKVPAGSRVKVDCRWSHLPATKGQPFTEGNCILKYPKLDLHWMDPNYQVHYGNQPDLGIGMDGAGLLDVELVEMIDPIPKQHIKPALQMDNVTLVP